MNGHRSNHPWKKAGFIILSIVTVIVLTKVWSSPGEIKPIVLNNADQILKVHFGSMKENKTHTEMGHDDPTDFCQVGIPCVYPELVDLRIIVMVYHRHKSLEKLLDSLQELVLDGDSARLEIFIDRIPRGNHPHSSTLRAANSFKWRHGVTRVHVRQKHVGLYGQWIYSWGPPVDTKEIALILEDDLSVSPYAYRWLRAVRNEYPTNVQGYSLQSDTVMDVKPGKRDVVHGGIKDTVFMYRILGTWGFAPHPESWREFQHWFMLKNASVKPYMPDNIITKWYQDSEKMGRGEDMWSAWHIFFSSIRGFGCVYNNLNFYLNTSTASLVVNRRENGLHYSNKAVENTDELLSFWRDDFVQFPKTIKRFDYDGSVM